MLDSVDSLVGFYPHGTLVALACRTQADLWLCSRMTGTEPVRLRATGHASGRAIEECCPVVVLTLSRLVNLCEVRSDLQRVQMTLVLIAKE
jgi:hypothetical protein